MLEIKNSITGKRLEVAENDFENEMDWDSAINACKNLGNGWRLPTKDEFEDIFNFVDGQLGNGNFKTGVNDKNFYWSSTEDELRKKGGIPSKMYAFAFSFYNQDSFEFEKSCSYSVRAVRDL
jgi:hypothetical protein